MDIGKKEAGGSGLKRKRDFRGEVWRESSAKEELDEV